MITRTTKLRAFLQSATSPAAARNAAACEYGEALSVVLEAKELALQAHRLGVAHVVFLADQVLREATRAADAAFDRLMVCAGRARSR